MKTGLAEFYGVKNNKTLDKTEGNVQILPRGLHKFPFRFQLPESSLPCSFESKAGQIRYNYINY